MFIAIIKKIFKNQNKLNSKLCFYIQNLSKFLLKVLNMLLYNCKVSRILPIKFLFFIKSLYF